jgi:hypothetical protein
MDRMSQPPGPLRATPGGDPRRAGKAVLSTSGGSRLVGGIAVYSRTLKLGAAPRYINGF